MERILYRFVVVTATATTFFRVFDSREVDLGTLIREIIGHCVFVFLWGGRRRLSSLLMYTEI